MTTLAIYPDTGGPAIGVIRDYQAIRDAMHNIGVQLERWSTRGIADDADAERVKAAYADEIAELNQQYGFQSVDVIALQPDNPQAAEFREKFLAEHIHSDFEVRFFVDGEGLFYLHVEDRVYAILCEKGDLISVPENTTHWFDMGARPNFRCIRFFVIPDGWVGEFTGDDIASRHVSYEEYLAEHR
jgi:1,2-dihydroxy-3-keto-5-methylthiopentene dioxygenase